MRLTDFHMLNLPCDMQAALPAQWLFLTLIVSAALLYVCLLVCLCPDAYAVPQRLEETAVDPLEE